MSQPFADEGTDMSSDSEYSPDSEMLVKANKSVFEGDFEVLSLGTVFKENDNGARVITVKDTTVVLVDKQDVWRCVSHAEGDSVVHHQLTCSQEEKAITAGYKDQDSKARIEWNRLLSINGSWPENASEQEKTVFGETHGMSTPLAAHIKKRQQSRKRRTEPKVKEETESTPKKRKAADTERKPEQTRIKPTLVAPVVRTPAASPSKRKLATETEVKVEPMECITLPDDTTSTSSAKVSISIANASPEEVSGVLRALLTKLQ